MHTPQELAAMNDCTDILRYLDGIASKQVINHMHLLKSVKVSLIKSAYST